MLLAVTGAGQSHLSHLPQLALPQLVLPQLLLPQLVLPQLVLPQLVLLQFVLLQLVLSQLILLQLVLPPLVLSQKDRICQNRAPGGAQEAVLGPSCHPLFSEGQSIVLKSPFNLQRRTVGQISVPLSAIGQKM